MRASEKRYRYRAELLERSVDALEAGGVSFRRSTSPGEEPPAGATPGNWELTADGRRNERVRISRGTESRRAYPDTTVRCARLDHSVAKVWYAFRTVRRSSFSNISRTRFPTGRRSYPIARQLYERGSPDSAAKRNPSSTTQFDSVGLRVPRSREGKIREVGHWNRADERADEKSEF